MFDDLRERATAAAEYELEPEEPKAASALTDMLETFTPQQRFVLSLMLLLNVVVIGCMCLIATGSVQF